MEKILQMAPALRAAVEEQGGVEHLDAAESTSAYMVLAGVKALGKSSISDVGRCIQRSTSIDLSTQNLTNIAQRLEKHRLLKRVSGSGNKGDPKTYQLTVEGDIELKNAIDTFLVLLTFGVESTLECKRRSAGPSGSRGATPEPVVVFSADRARSGRQAVDAKPIHSAEGG